MPEAKLEDFFLLVVLGQCQSGAKIRAHKNPQNKAASCLAVTVCTGGAPTHSCGREGLRKGSESLPLTTLALRCLDSEADATDRDGDAGLGGFLLVSSFLCRSMSSLCWLMPSCCLHAGQGWGGSRRVMKAEADNGHDMDSTGATRPHIRARATAWFYCDKNCWLSLDQVLKCVSVSPLLRVWRPVSDCGEVTQAETILHALLATWLLLLGALCVKKSGDTTRQKCCEQFHTHTDDSNKSVRVVFSSQETTLTIVYRNIAAILWWQKCSAASSSWAKSSVFLHCSKAELERERESN